MSSSLVNYYELAGIQPLNYIPPTERPTPEVPLAPTTTSPPTGCRLDNILLDLLSYAPWMESRLVQNRHLITRTRMVVPISVVKTDDGSYKIIDGNHRCTVAYELGYDRIPAFIQNDD